MPSAPSEPRALATGQAFGHRFLNREEREVMKQIAELVRRKDTLDYHHSLQLTLKLWLFVHIPLTYSLLIFSLVHIVLVYAFSGGAR